MQSKLFRLNRWLTSFVLLGGVIFLIGGCVPANQPPVITSLKAKQNVIAPLDSYLIECVASDEDGDELSYEWSASKGDTDGDGATVTWTAPDSEGLYNIVAKVTDGNGGEAMDCVTISVRVNNPPTITSLIADVDWVTPSSNCRIECNAEDPDGDELSYEWSADRGDIAGVGSVVTWTAPEGVGLYNITVVVTDGQGGEGTRSLSIGVVIAQPPVIESLIVTPKGHEYLREYSGHYKVGKAMSCDIECIVSDTSGELVYEWSCDDGEISGEGSMITWTAPDRAVEVTVTVTVSDGDGNMVTRSIVFKVVRCSSCTFR